MIKEIWGVQLIVQSCAHFKDDKMVTLCYAFIPFPEQRPHESSNSYYSFEVILQFEIYYTKVFWD